MKTRLGMLSAAVLMTSSYLAVDDGWWNETVNRPERIYGPSGHEVSPPPLIPYGPYDHEVSPPPLIPFDNLPWPPRGPSRMLGPWPPWGQVADPPSPVIYRLNYIELHVDCDDDGISDCQQILVGTYEALNGDGIPDCCGINSRDSGSFYRNTNWWTLNGPIDPIDIDRYSIGFDVDCNGDDIVDCRQILDGTYEDLDGNGILDCCESDEPCYGEVSKAVEWPIEEGGNGHWYQCIRLGYAPEHPGTSWTWCREQAELAGGHLATITSMEENDWLKKTIVMPLKPASVHLRRESAPQLGGWKVDGQWQWITGEPWTYDGFAPRQFNDGDRLEYWRWPYLWWEGRPDGFSDSIHTYLIEWDADCNGDGIVDYGQILDGTYEDLDGNGIPDCCEDEGNCELCTTDVYPDGAIDISDLLIVIAYYGLLEPAAGDVNLDGQVDSEDILGVLDQWGTCDAP